MKKIIGLKLLCTTLAASSILAIIPLFGTSCSKSDTEWDINKTYTLHTEDIQDWDFSKGGAESQFKTFDYTKDDTESDKREKTDPEMVEEIQSQLTAWAVINCLVQLVASHNDTGDDYQAFLEVKGIHIRQSDHALKIDHVQYRYDSDGGITRELVGKSIGYVPLLACKRVPDQNYPDEIPNKPTLEIGRSAASGVPCWDVVSNIGKSGKLPYMSCPLNFYNTNGCKFPYELPSSGGTN